MNECHYSCLLGIPWQQTELVIHSFTHSFLEHLLRVSCASETVQLLKVGGEGNKPCSQMAGTRVRRVMGWLSAASAFYLSCDNTASSEGSRGGKGFILPQ